LTHSPERFAPLLMSDVHVGDNIDVLAFGVWCPGYVLRTGRDFVCVRAVHRGGMWEGLEYAPGPYDIEVRSVTLLRYRVSRGLSSGIRRRGSE
jgi:hypothetical protein